MYILTNSLRIMYVIDRIRIYLGMYQSKPRIHSLITTKITKTVGLGGIPVYLFSIK